MSDPQQNLVHAASLLQNARHIAVLSGAGVSAESGLATFRNAGGLWEGHRPEQVATPEAFEANPQLVWHFYNARRAALWKAQPNDGHYALAELQSRPAKLTLITQNVDRLHQRAGSRDVIELHGNLEEVRCADCCRIESRVNEDLGESPRCACCNGRLRPAVVWFGEMLPQPEMLAAQHAAAECDVFLIVGTSAIVYPAAGLAHFAHANGAAVIEVNLERTDASSLATIGLYGPAAKILPELVSRLRG